MHKWFKIIGMVFLIVLAAMPAQAGDNDGKAELKNFRMELEQFADDYFAGAFEDYSIPGAVFVVVRDGQVVLARGYGFADISEKKPVDPEKTMFCAGSVGKLVNWTALLQLYEQGLFDLDDDINHYLKEIQIPAVYPQPVTFHHLLTHTAGFDDRNTAATPETFDRLKPLSEYLAATLPGRIRPPGEVTQYSNHGAVISGLIIEDISGEGFADYADRHIFEVLGMGYSTFHQPQPDHLRQHMATGYHLVGGFHQEQPIRIANVMPAGMGYFSGADMAKFMIAHLQQGSFGEKQMLSAETVKLMHQTQFKNDPRLPGMAYGFIENEKNGRRILWHTGTSPDFHSLLALIPADDTGIFFSMNMVDHRVSRELLQNFMDTFYPEELAPVAQAALNADGLEPYTGLYRSNWYARNTLEKLAVLGRDVPVSLIHDGTLLVGFENAPGSRWIPLGGHLFHQAELDEFISFALDDAGVAYRLFQGSRPIVAYDRIDWWESTAFHLLLQVFVTATMISMLLAAFVGWINRKRVNKNAEVPPAARRARLFANLSSMLYLLFLPGFIAVQMKVVTGEFDLFFYAVITIPTVFIVFTVAVVYCGIVAWMRNYWGIGGRLHYSLFVIASVLNSWALFYWNLIGYNV